VSETIIHSHHIFLQQELAKLETNVIENKNERFITIINNINKTLTSLIQLDTPSKLSTLYSSVKTQIIFSIQLNRVITRQVSDIEIGILFQTFQGRSSFLIEMYMSQIINKIDDNIYPSELFKIANKVFTFAEKNSGWCSKNQNKLSQILTMLQNNIHSVDISPEKIIKLANHAEIALCELNPKIVFTEINTGTISSKVNTLKFLYVSKYAQKIYMGNYSETSSRSISFDELSPDTFRAIKTYIDTHRTDILNTLSTHQLIKIYEWTSRLMIDSDITKKWANEINCRASNMTIQPTTTNDLSLSFNGQPSDDSLLIITNPAINTQITEINLSEIENIDNESLRNILSVFSNTGTLRVSFPNSIERSGWIQLYSTVKVKDLHLDFKNFTNSDTHSFQQTVYSLKEVVDSLKTINFDLKIHVHNAGKIDFEILQMIHHSLAVNIATLDLCDSQISGVQFDEILEGTKNLARLNLSHCKNITEPSLILITEKCPLITDLSLNQTKYITDSAVQSICKHGKAITILNLAWQSTLSNATFESIANNCTKITALDLTNTNKITDSSICIIATKCKKLATLKLNWCSQLTSESLNNLSANSNDLRDLILTGAFKRENKPSIESLGAFLDSINKPLKLTISKHLFSTEAVNKLRTDHPSTTIHIHTR